MDSDCLESRRAGDLGPAVIALLLRILDRCRAALERLRGEPAKDASLADRVAPAGKATPERAIFAIGSDGQPKEYRPVGIHGLGLLCRAIDSNEVRFIDAGMSSDIPGFCRVWKELGGMSQGLMYPDGTPYDPEI